MEANLKRNNNISLRSVCYERKYRVGSYWCTKMSKKENTYLFDSKKNDKERCDLHLFYFLLKYEMKNMKKAVFEIIPYSSFFISNLWITF